MKPRVRVKAPSRMYGHAIPDDAQPGDLIVGNRGAAALVCEDVRLRVLYPKYAGNVDFGAKPLPGGKVYNFR